MVEREGQTVEKDNLQYALSSPSEDCATSPTGLLQTPVISSFQPVP